MNIKDYEHKLKSQESKIIRLEKCIKEFKKYDSERKKYYSDSLIELGKLKAYVLELEDSDKKAKKIRDQRNELVHLNRIIYNNKYLNILTLNPEQIEGVTILELKETIKKLSEQNRKLNRENRKLLQDISDLCSKLYSNN